MLEGAVFRSFIVSDEVGRFLAMGESPASGRLPHGGQPVLTAIAVRAKARLCWNLHWRKPKTVLSNEISVDLN